jgi:hypothetical protein
VRYRCDESALCRLGGATGYESRWARVRDVSVCGVGLRVSGAIEPGRDLTVEFTDSASFRRILAARVIHSSAQSDGTWVVGCRFVTPLREDELRAFLGPTPEQSVPAAPRR